MERNGKKYRKNKTNSLSRKSKDDFLLPQGDRRHTSTITKSVLLYLKLCVI